MRFYVCVVGKQPAAKLARFDSFFEWVAYDEGETLSGADDPRFVECAAIIRRGRYADSIATPEAFENQRAHIKANPDTDQPLTRYKVKQ